VDDDSLRHLTHLPNLRHLDLAGTVVTSKAIPYLAKMKQLHDVRLDGSEFHRDDRARLQAAIPACKLEFLAIPLPVYAPVPVLNATGQ
jgi:hypothetical protein